MLSAVEAHVLQEVCKAVLGRIFLLDGAYVSSKIEFRAALGELVVADVVSETILKMADGDLFRIGELGHLCNHGLHLLAGGLPLGEQRESHK